MPGDSSFTSHLTTFTPGSGFWATLVTTFCVFCYCKVVDKQKSPKKSMKDYKGDYRGWRDAFAADERNREDLRHWKDKDAIWDYKLKGLIPDDRIVGTRQQMIEDSLVPYARSDTYFSEYELHNKQDLILSSSDRSYIIGNAYSYDERQYPYAPSDSNPAGQGFGHCLVIPKKRIHNIVDPEAVADNCDVIKELQNHFIGFWKRPERNGPSKILARAEKVFDAQNNKLLADDTPRFKELVTNVKANYNVVAPEFKKLKETDFMYAFHASPEMSIGHLHLHVFPKGEPFRKFSATRHDWKTIPFEDVIQVEREDALARGEVQKG